MYLFLDTANIDEITEINQWGVLDGVTTNPSLVGKEEKDFKTLVQKICAIVEGPVSAEVTGEDAESMIKEGREIAKWAENVVVKCPLTEAGLAATRVLSDEGIKVNVTLCFSVNQALLAARAGAYFVSPFIGRLDDINQDGCLLVEGNSRNVRDQGLETHVLAAASAPPCMSSGSLAGADIIPLPYKVFKQLVKHPASQGMEKF
ncbi:MAG: transaldolase family protein [Cyanobacteriota/Melainabacteria group bacterium]